MSLRRKISRLKGNFAPRLNSFWPGSSGIQSTALSSSSSALIPSALPTDIRSEICRLATPEEACASTSGHAQAQPTTPHSSGAAATTPIQSATTNSWTSLKVFLTAIDRPSSLLGPLKGVVDELLGCIEIYERVANGRKDFKELHDELDSLFKTLDGYFSHGVSPAMTASMESLCKSILQELEYVKRKQGRGATKRSLEAGDDEDDVLTCYRRISGHLQRLSLNANLSTWNIVDERATDDRLARLCPSLSACYNSTQATELKRGDCTPGTRLDVLGGMCKWAYGHNTGSLYWLNGMAGTGKTTITYSLCIELNASSNLGASFFCSRLLPECRDVNRIVPSIAYQLAYFSRPFRWALSRVLEKEPNVHTQLLDIQFERLIIAPLAEVRNTLPKNLVVVIDALDECDNKKSTSQILNLLLTKTPGLPIKFFIASRPEPEIRNEMKKQAGRRAISRLVLHELDQRTVQGDVEKYLRDALGPIEPSDSEIAELTQRAGILFIYAATVVRYIGYKDFNQNPRKRLENVLNVSSASGNNPYRDVDELYTLILQAAIDDPGLDDGEREDVKRVLRAVICAQEPLTIRALSGLLGLQDVGRVHAALCPLWSVLHVVEPNGLVTTLHASFPDFMFDPNRSKSYYCDPTDRDHALVQYCFDCIKGASPQFNICGLESSYVPDEKVENLSTKLENAIAPELYYACRYWAAHLERVGRSPEVVKRLEDFLFARMLLWMEVMNLNNCMHTGVGMIQKTEDWCVRQVCSEDLIQFARDAWRFVAAFTSSALSQSTPHIYVSMLPFWPETSPVGKHYGTRIQVPMVPQGTAISRRQVELLAMWPVHGQVTLVAWSSDGARIALVTGGQLYLHDPLTGQLILGPLNQTTHSIQSVQFSPNNSLIVSGSDDRVVRVWEAKCGKVLGPLKGHTGSVDSVAFSHDGTRIISGSKDKSIRLWDTQSRKSILDPLEGHMASVTSVIFSPDDTRIVSGSYDRTIRIWDARSGKNIVDPLKGHTDSVTSVTFSPDGSRIASCSCDKTICMWDTQSGEMVLGPLKGHTGWVTSVVFSHDGTRIVSGSKDKTIRMWDAQTDGKMVLGPLKGHTGSVTSVAFSPDDTRIFSGSSDKTVRMWDARSRQTRFDPLEAHTSSVTSVAFSPNGAHIISGSCDNTVHMWDARSGETMFGPLEGHTSPVASVAFSPDGTRIASGSYDSSIRIWDARSGQTVLGPLEGHMSWVSSVAFSPDSTRIISGSHDNTIHMWDAQSGQSVLGPLRGYTSPITSVAFSPNSTRAVSGSSDSTICLWDLQSGKMVLGPLEGHTSWITSVAFSPDSARVISGSWDKTLRIWDVQSGHVVLGPLKGHTDTVTSVAFSPDGSYIASGSSDKTIRLWDARSGQTMFSPLEGHADWVTSVAFSPDGIYVVSGSNDKTIRVWDARIGQRVVPSFNHGSDAHTTWRIRPDGWVLDGEDESKLLVWVPSDLRPVLLPPRCVLGISTTECVGLNFITPRIGESWTGCYQPV